VEHPAFDTPRFRQVLGHFATGITVVTASDDDGAVGFTCQSFSSLSLDPPLVVFAPSKQSSSWPRIKGAGHFAVNILSEDQEDVCRRFATPGIDKFAGQGWRAAPATGAPILDGVLAWIDCTIEAEHDGGDHLLVAGRVHGLEIVHEGKPLLFFRGGYGRFEG
jgi:3-hydroxy-9,10-secoandrosta-1,3,5(10)-triene-9,17-dione monooxygenase reductase component